MAITVRKGSEVQFDINKMLPGEFAVTTDTHKVFVCTSAGHTRELASVEELQQILDVSDEAFVAFQELINAMESNDVITGLLNDIEKLKEDIKKNNGFKELTKAEYEALSEEEKNSGTLYLITDDTDEYKAGLIEYNNANSGLTAKDVQGAIDETNVKIDSNFKKTIKCQTYSSSMNGLKTGSNTVDFDISKEMTGKTIIARVPVIHYSGTADIHARIGTTATLERNTVIVRAGSDLTYGTLYYHVFYTD